MTKTGDPPFRVLIDGKDFTALVTSVNNSMLLDELERSASFEIRADETKRNLQLLGEFFNYSNRFAPVKIYTRGYYSDKENLRISGYLTHISGGSIFTGLTATVKSTSPAADTSGAPQASAGEPIMGKTVTQIVNEILKTSGFEPGKIDDFPIVYGVWYPGNRTAFEQLYVLADAVGAIVNIRPPVAKVEKGAIKVNGLFEIKPEDGGEADEKLKKSLFVLQSSAGNSIDLENQVIDDDYIRKEGLVPTPTDLNAQRPYFGPGQRKNPNDEDPRNGFYYSADDQYKSSSQKQFEELQKKSIDPKITQMIKEAGITAYYDPEEKAFVHAVKMRDNSGKEVTVPIDVAAASLKADMVIDFIDSDEKKGMLGPSGLILTLKDVELNYPYLRAKSVGGFEYNVPATSRQAATPSTPSVSNPFGAASKNYRVQAIQVKPSETVADVAKKVESLGLFREVAVNNPDGTTEKLYIAYDPELLMKDEKTGEIDPISRIENQELTEAEKKATQQKLVPLTIEEFNQLTPAQIQTLYRKRRADALSDEDSFIRQFYPDLYQQRQDYLNGKSQDNSFDGKIQQAIQWELENNLYANSGPGDDIYYKKREGAAFASPVFKGTEQIGNYLGKSTTDSKEMQLYVGGEEDSSSKTNGHGKTAVFRAQSLTFNPATGADLLGTEVVQKGDWPFTFSVSIDNAVELVTGTTVNCDETFGPLMGTYVIGSIEEGLSGSSKSMNIELRTQAYMDGLGRAMNVAGDTGNEDGTEATQGAFAGQALPTPGRAKGSNAGISIAKTAREGLNASWSSPVRGTCSAFVRSSVENAYGLKSTPLNGGALSNVLFGASAMDTGRLMRNQGLVTDFNANGGLSGLRAGDIILQEYDSEGYGHIGIVGEDGAITYENSWSLPGPDYRGTRTTAKFGRITGVVKAEDLDAWMKQKGYAK